MLKTPLGNIRLFENNIEKKYSYKSLKVSSQHFLVDECISITLKITKNIQNVKVILDMDKNKAIKSEVESGEGLSLISFLKSNLKLSVGTIGDIIGIEYFYLDNGISLTLSKEIDIEELVFNIAWLNMKNPEEESIFTWFAADPTLMGNT
ncbi:hypothetical protein ACWOC1_02195 [Enterococcus quebecensis]|uniref:Uncharacterized protein n=1 Tax=Enterococcus quebecensis TaxID=903983 RepID=A0A1E5H3X8_9ENTE|nr:hypothetical protein [Enterococcus quebecensis]OEG19370.1 hypothetical protein BCR23_01400 [Enterococcus quebecensis]OJG75707.1 hypothetical protein RV12_GL000046 [Enterococcus quebecensis]